MRTLLTAHYRCALQEQIDRLKKESLYDRAATVDLQPQPDVGHRATVSGAPAHSERDQDPQREDCYSCGEDSEIAENWGGV